MFTLLGKGNTVIPGDQFLGRVKGRNVWINAQNLVGRKLTNTVDTVVRRKGVGVGNHIRGKGKPIHVWIDERLGTVQPWGQGYGSSLTDNQANFIKIAKKHEFRLNKLESFIERAILAGYSVHISKG